ncbi:MAG: ATP-dependent zinc metalloprotease FtsH [Chloroflexota bacterium]|nr:MAG: ATP-dependent zinc metalloprotease FtsH [Chloroflexota bacterium]
MNSDHQSNAKRWRRALLSPWMIVILLLLNLTGWLYFYSRGSEQQDSSSNITGQSAPLQYIVQAIQAGEVESLRVRGNLITAIRTNKTALAARKEEGVSAVQTLQLFGVPPDTLAKLPIVVEEPPAEFSFGAGLLLGLPFLLMYLLFRGAWQEQGSPSASNFNTVGKSNPRIISKSNDKETRSAYSQVTFHDVAGAEQAKLELREIIEFLKEPGKFTKLGARVPKGVLMAGPPGTGKTLMAKAVAGEAGVPFFSISGSEFVEMFVGVGAARVRDLFKKAREQSPAVIFVDEIDAVGRRRGASIGSGNDEREQTLNQLLVEMDGFGTDTNVIVMASTNRPDILDPALLRPGRFDRKVILDRPDVQEREAILKVHTQGKPLASNISLTDLAKMTPGFVGADLENLVNEAAILAARRNLCLIGRAEFQDALERTMAGPERQSKILSDQERQVVAYHEAGHAVVMYHLPHADPIHKVSIVSRGMALGYVLPLPAGDKYLRTREAFEDEIVGLLGGRAAEEIIFNRITTGAANDLERATQLARSMVTRYGFSQKLGLRTFGEERGNPYLGSLGEIRNYSEEMAQAIDQEMGQILARAYERAQGIILAHRHRLEKLATSLLEHETVERPAFEAMMA